MTPLDPINKIWWSVRPSRVILIFVRRMIGSRLLLVLMLAGIVVVGQADSPADVFGFGSSNVTRFTGRLDGDPGSTVEVKVGQVVQIDVLPVGGRRPALAVTEFNDRDGYTGVVVPVTREVDNNQYRAVGVGRVKIEGVPRQVLDRCPCIDLVGEYHFVVSIIVSA